MTEKQAQRVSHLLSELRYNEQKAKEVDSALMINHLTVILHEEYPVVYHDVFKWLKSKLLGMLNSKKKELLDELSKL